MTTWNSFDSPPPIGVSVLFIGPDGRIYPGEAVDHQIIQIRSMPGLGRQFKAAVIHQGKKLIPPMIALASDHIMCKAIHRESWLLLEGVGK
jgi:hypothetical protein